VFQVLQNYGVEAARNAVIEELIGVFSVYGIAVNHRHLSLVADYMVRLPLAHTCRSPTPRGPVFAARLRGGRGGEGERREGRGMSLPLQRCVTCLCLTTAGVAFLCRLPHVWQTFEGGYRGMNRGSMKSNVNPFLKMSFETTTDFLRSATLVGDYDPLLVCDFQLRAVCTHPLRYWLFSERFTVSRGRTATLNLFPSAFRLVHA